MCAEVKENKKCFVDVEKNLKCISVLEVSRWADVYSNKNWNLKSKLQLLQRLRCLCPQTVFPLSSLHLSPLPSPSAVTSAVVVMW